MTFESNIVQHMSEIWTYVILTNSDLMFLFKMFLSRLLFKKICFYLVVSSIFYVHPYLGK